MIVRHGIRDFLKANGASTETAIVADCVAQGAMEKQVKKILERWVNRGSITKNGDTYDFLPSSR